MDGATQLSQLNMNLCDIWVRLHDVPFNWRTSGIVTKIAGCMGEVVDIDEENIEITTAYVRVRIRWNVQRKLLRCLNIQGRTDVDEIIVIPMQYEKLPNFCYNCGIMGHVYNDCELERQTTESGDWPYDSTLRAIPSKLKVVMSVAVKKGYSGGIRSGDWRTVGHKPTTRRELFCDDSTANNVQVVDVQVGVIDMKTIDTGELVMKNQTNKVPGRDNHSCDNEEHAAYGSRPLQSQPVLGQHQQGQTQTRLRRIYIKKIAWLGGENGVSNIAEKTGEAHNVLHSK
ncbi:hypothetical protein M5689_010964 [Euphorbia peplus]|nr:hypothetical protein M5689_010964 [Euphorbia peplus]